MNVSTKLGCAVVTLIAAMGASPGVSNASITGMTDVVFEPLPAGVTPGLYGTAQLLSASPLTVGFPITGGMLMPTVSIEHDGSGVELSTAAASVFLTNFLIQVPPGDVLGTVGVGSAGTGAPVTPLFDLGTGGTGFANIPLDLTAAAASFLNTNLFPGESGPFSAGEELGVATVNIGTVPEPSTWAMMGLGFAALGAVGWRGSRRNAAAVA